jgi:hypothetical protein
MAVRGAAGKHYAGKCRFRRPNAQMMDRILPE